MPPVQEPMYTRSIFTSLQSLANARLSGECGCTQKETDCKWSKQLQYLRNYWFKLGYINSILLYKLAKTTIGDFIRRHNAILIAILRSIILSSICVSSDPEIRWTISMRQGKQILTVIRSTAVPTNSIDLYVAPETVISPMICVPQGAYKYFKYREPALAKNPKTPAVSNPWPANMTDQTHLAQTAVTFMSKSNVANTLVVGICLHQIRVRATESLPQNIHISISALVRSKDVVIGDDHNLLGIPNLRAHSTVSTEFLLENPNGPRPANICHCVSHLRENSGRNRETVAGTLEFLDDDQYTNLESALLALGCRECVLPAEHAKSVDGRRLRDVLARCNVRLTEKKKAEFKSRDIEQDLSRLIKSTSVGELRELVVKYEVASAALAALLAYTDIFADDSNHGKYRLQQYSLDRYMRLDAAALRALHVLESKNDPNKNSTLFGLMNRTSTAGMGKRLLNRWLKQPLLDVDETKHRHDVVHMFVEDAELRESLKNCLKRVPDVERLTRKLERSRATLQDLVKLYQVSVRLSVVKDALERYEGEFASAIEERAIDLDQIKNGEYIISASYDSSLKTIKADRDAVEEEIREAHEQATNDLDLPADKSLKLDKTTQWGHVFRSTKEEEPKVRKKLAIGVNIMMAQVGCFLPCDRAEISIRSCIFARVGRRLPELFATLFATHFHELTSISHRQGPSAHGPSKGPPVGISNFHVSAHIDPNSRKLTMLYKVEDGPCDQSFGIHVAEFLDFQNALSAELEDFSPQAILEDKGDAGSKRKRSSSSSSSRDKGWKFLKGFAAWPLDQMRHKHALKKGQKVKVPTFRVPATQKVWVDLYAMPLPEADGKTCAQIFEEAGCDSPTSPSCAACLGGPKETYA
ncbi:hypothetical protein SELMODRAFT_407609 [Selaginella moellendorffii]|uniref:DNA mismatch repair protein MutS core domain-containing protein n=1 Tax=Selaginella moellendorffii TaxID=88036 RepID=D8R658_SELML|nr:hypothetical protein SELMODRAFT_407609 [Selaginella moellendorffii]